MVALTKTPPSIQRETFRRQIASKVDRDKHDEGSLTISTAALLAATLVVSRLGGPAGMERTALEGHEGKAQTQANPELIAKLREASKEATREWRNGNKDNPVFGQKSAQN